MTFAGGVFFGMLAGQPLIIVGITGPVLLFDELLYNVSNLVSLRQNCILALQGVGCVVWPKQSIDSLRFDLTINTICKLHAGSVTVISRCIENWMKSGYRTSIINGSPHYRFFDGYIGNDLL